MSTTKFAGVLEAWNSQYDGIPRDNLENSLRFQLHLIRALVRGRPLSEADVVAATRETPAYVRQFMSQADRLGAEVDDHGNLVGAVLTLNPTPHRLSIGPTRLYAWCALDTLFLPSLIGATAHVQSTCPVSGEDVELLVAPERIVSFKPRSLAVSIVDPSKGSCSTPGPESELCTGMRFFSTREAGLEWQTGRDDVIICTPEQAHEVARVTTRFMRDAVAKAPDPT